MIRLLHLVAISMLVASAGYAYSIKYDTLYYSETLTKLKAQIQREREGVAVAKAEWALLTRPDRLQRMVERHLDLQPMTIAQLGRLSDLPNRPAKSDMIGAKLDALGVLLSEPASTGSVAGRPTAPKRDGGLASKLLSLGLGSSTAVARPTASPKPQAAR